MNTIDVPDKSYFKIGEVAKLLNVEPYVLRYWESEFDDLQPEKTKTGQRVYQRPDIDLLITIHHLLYEELYTIAGARRQLDKFRIAKVAIADIPKAQKMVYSPLDEDAAPGDTPALDQELGRLQSEHENLLSKNKELNEELEEVYSQLACAREQCASLTASLEALEQRHDQALEEDTDAHLDTSVDGQWEQIHVDLQREVERLCTELECAHQKNEQLRQHHTAILAQREAHKRSVLTALRHEVENLSAFAQA